MNNHDFNHVFLYQELLLLYRDKKTEHLHIEIFEANERLRQKSLRIHAVAHT